MARGPGHRPLIVLRWIILGLFLIAVAAVVWIYLGRGSGPAPRVADPQRQLGEMAAEDVVLAAEGFEYEVIDEGKTLFFISADRMISDRENRFALEGVRLSFTNEDGDLYQVASRIASYDLETRNAHLEGAVRLAGPDGLELRGEGFDVKQRGRVLVSTTSPADFSLPGGHQGSARRVRINLHRNNLVLGGGVVVDSAPGTDPPVRWTAQRMAYKESEALLRSEGGVSFRRGEDRLNSRRLSATFDGGEGGSGKLRFVQASWEVDARLALDSGSDGGRALEVEASRLGLTLADSDEIRRVVIQGPPWARARVHFDDGAGLRQTVISERILTDFADGSLSRLETETPAELEERLALAGSAPLRRLCGDSLAARFAGGGLADLTVEGSVGYQDGELAAVGERLAGDPEDDVRLTGEPARLVSRRGEVAAPEIVYSRGAGSVRATGGVRATGLEGSGVALAASDEAEPLQVTAAEASWSEEPSEVVFTGDVRAWQGESFLLAREMKTFDNGSRLEAVGDVKSVWKPAPDDPEDRRPVEVNAGRMVYRRHERRLDYSQAVRVHEAGRSLSCEEMELTVDEGRRVERLLCQTNAVVEDPASGRTVRGVEALYTPADRQVLITGQPVRLTERSGATIEGRRLLYHLDTGEVRILSEPRTSDRQPTDVPGDEG